MKRAPQSIADGLDTLSSIEGGRPYSLRLEDPKRRLADAVAASVHELGIRPLVIGGLAVSHHGYLRVSLDLDLLVAKHEGLRTAEARGRLGQLVTRAPAELTRRRR